MLSAPTSGSAIRKQNMPKILIVGASGFVGAAIVRAANARHDITPIACMRRAAPELDSIGVETRICDAVDPIALASALEGVTYVVNSVLGSPATMCSVTRNICEAAPNTGLRRIVHLSSMAVYGPVTGTVDETARLQPASAYGRAKADCEMVVRDFIAAGGEAVLLRPGCVYGPGGEQWVGRIARWLQADRLGELGEMADGYCNLTFNDDLAAAVMAALTIPEAAGEAFNIADVDPGTWNQYFLHLGREIGASVRRVSRLRMSLEAAILAPPLQIAKIVGQRIGVRPGFIPEPITPSLLALWRQQIRLDYRKADAALAFARSPPQWGLTQSAKWFRSTGFNR
jgi:nucleoside-diphosphate-sugar epimerase